GVCAGKPWVSRAQVWHSLASRWNRVPVTLQGRWATRELLRLRITLQHLAQVVLEPRMPAVHSHQLHRQGRWPRVEMCSTKGRIRVIDLDDRNATEISM